MVGKLSLRVCTIQDVEGALTLERDLEHVLWELKGQEVVLIIAPLGPTEELPVICGLCGTTYDGDQCPTCNAEREQAKKVIEETLRKDREENNRLIKDVEEWLEERKE